MNTLRKKLPKQDIAAALELAVADHVADREDQHGFSRLDALLAELEGMGAKGSEIVEAAVVSLLPKLTTAHPKAWEALRMATAASKLKSDAVASHVIQLLDRFKEPSDPAARFQAFLIFRQVGGVLTRPRLEQETSMMQHMRPQWVDLVLSACVGAPETMIVFLEEQLRTQAERFTWEDVRKRLPFLFRLLGSDFNRAIVRIVKAVPSKVGREKLAGAVSGSFKLETLAEPDRIEAPIVAPTSGERLGSGSRRRFQDVFEEIVPPGLMAWKERSRLEQHGAV